MKTKFIFTVTLICVTLCVPLSVFGQDFEMNGTTLVKYNGSAANVTIPEGVTAIGDRAFYNNSSLTSITIPSSVTSIGDYSFYGCTSLTSITIPSGVTVIGENAFHYCRSLANITIPSSVTSIGENAFANTAWFNNQPDGLVYAGKVLYRYKGTMPANTVINNIRTDTTGIAGDAFYNCTSLTSVTIPSSVTSIGELAFAGCDSLTNITIPSSVTSIGNGVFWRCKNLTSVTVDIKNPVYSSIDGVLFNKNRTVIVAYPAGKQGTSYTIPSSVTTIGIYAFDGINLTNITVDTQNQEYSSVDGVLFNKNRTVLVTYPAGKQGRYYTIPTGVTFIGNGAFRNCIRLTGVALPSSVTSIGNSAFVGCSNLRIVTIPSSVTSIGELAFQGCTSLTSVKVSGRPRIGTSAFPSNVQITYSD